MNEDQLGTPRARLRRLIVSGTAFAVLVALPVGGYLLGKDAGQSAIYAAAYKEGRSDARAELALLLVKEQGIVAPIAIPEDEDLDCQTMTLLSARAGTLLGIQSAAELVSDQTP
jgi:hypothetical protein